MLGMPMATEAQRLINISLSKIALSRNQRGGLSLHRNLLVASVLQKARYVFMEETYQLINYSTMGMGPAAEAVEEEAPGIIHHHNPHHHVTYDPSLPHVDSPSSSPDSTSGDASSSEHSFHQMAPAAVDAAPPARSQQEVDSDKENSAPVGIIAPENTVVTYLDLDTSEQSREVLVDAKCNSPTMAAPAVTSTSSSSPPVSTPPSPTSKCLKRRRGALVPDWETEEAVSSILPKRQRRSWDVYDPSATTFMLQDELSELCSGISDQDEVSTSSAMEIDHITSLVSIFSFGGLVCGGGDASGASGATPNGANGGVGGVGGSGTSGGGKLTRSVSTPDLCSSQAKDNGSGAMGVVQRPYLAMTV